MAYAVRAKKSSSANAKLRSICKKMLRSRSIFLIKQTLCYTYNYMDVIIISQNESLTTTIHQILKNSEFNIITKPPAPIYIIDLDSLPVSQGFINNSALFIANPHNISSIPLQTSLPTDFVLKPIEAILPLEFLYRLKRLAKLAPAPILKSKNFKLDPVNHKAEFSQKMLQLSPTEFKLLQLFMQNPRKILTKSQIQTFCWPNRHQIPNNLIEVYIQKIRRKTSPTILTTIRGIGYKFND